MNKKIILIVSVLILFFVAAIFGIVSDYNSDKNRIQNIELVKDKLSQLKYIDEIITQLQKERGLSSIYYKNRSQKYVVALELQKKTTNFFINKASQLIDSTELLEERKKASDAIYNANISSFEAFMNYTKIIKKLLLQSNTLILETNNSDIKNSLIFYSQLNVLQETAGQLRGLVSGILTSQTISKDEYNELVILNRSFHENVDTLKGNIVLELALEKDSIKEAFEIINKITSINSVNDNTLKTLDIEPLKWFDIASCNVNTIRESIIQEFGHINTIVNTSLDEAQNRAMRHNTLWLLGTLLLFIVFLIAFNLSKRLISEQKLLKSYKNVIDKNPNSIVSKTDKNGIITYVNDTFCTVSKYKREELIGKPHKIVRHEDSPKKVFADLWSTIRSGKTWDGIVKNRSKDGTPYWVHASISPIYNDRGELIEYIAMRHNISEMIFQQEETERTQRELIYRLGESVESRSKESGNHVRRVAHYSKILALLAGLNEHEAETVFIASTMHDMGKIAIPDSILLKPGKLDKDEFEIMKTHSNIGYKLLAGSNLPILKMASIIAHEHHEHFNGNGYPLGIAGKDIAIHAKIVAIVDVFDALISDRVYKKAWDLEKVVDTIRSESGKQFDPILVELFLLNIDKFMEIKVKFEDV